jgi:acyl carrier protein phosphodiesterase
MLIDHHLAIHWGKYHHQVITDFSRERYQLTHDFDQLMLPTRLHKTLECMEKDDWLAGYKTPENLVRALNGMSRRIRFNNSMPTWGLWATQQAHNHFTELNTYIDFLLCDYS